MAPPARSPALVGAVLLATVAAVALAVGPLAGGPLDAGALGAVTGDAAPADGASPCVGTIVEEPDRPTLISIQGARGGDKTAALLVGVGPDGEVVGVHDGSAHGRWWLYDVDPLPNGNLLLASTEPGITVVQEVDPTTGEHVWVERFDDVFDSHDVDYVGDDEFVMVDMHDDHNRVLVYNRSREEVVWEWRFDDHTDEFPTDGGGPHGEDWTHVNDVDEIDDGVYMLSVRNFDQVIAVDRSTDEIVWRLGADDDHDVLFEQHNPDYLEGENGTPTVLVADSLNDRVVEYARDDGEWVRTWEVGGLREPRDADRLPNGNTLVSDRRGHRLVELTPTGEVVWEVYTPWQPYDAERYGLPPGSDGPTARQLGATGSHEMTGSAGFGADRIEACYDYLTDGDRDDRLVAERAATANGSWTDDDRSDDYTPVDPAGDQPPLVGRGLDAGLFAVAALLALGAAAAWRLRR